MTTEERERRERLARFMEANALALEGGQFLQSIGTCEGCGGPTRMLGVVLCEDCRPEAFRNVAEIVRSEGEKAAVVGDGGGIVAIRYRRTPRSKWVYEDFRDMKQNADIVTMLPDDGETQFLGTVGPDGWSRRNPSPDNASPVRSEGWKEIGEEGWPDRIYLAPPEEAERTWCADKIDDDWREYRLAPNSVSNSAPPIEEKP